MYRTSSYPKGLKRSIENLGKSNLALPSSTLCTLGKRQHTLLSCRNLIQVIDQWPSTSLRCCSREEGKSFFRPALGAALELIDANVVFEFAAIMFGATITATRVNSRTLRRS